MFPEYCIRIRTKRGIYGQNTSSPEGVPDTPPFKVQAYFRQIFKLSFIHECLSIMVGPKSTENMRLHANCHSTAPIITTEVPQAPVSIAKFS